MQVLEAAPAPKLEHPPLAVQLERRPVRLLERKLLGVEHVLGQQAELVECCRVLEEGPPHGDAPTRTHHASELGQPRLLVDPVEARGGDGEVEGVVAELCLLEQGLFDPQGVPRGGVRVPEIRRQARIRLDGDDRGAGLEEATRHQSRPRPDLEYLGAGAQTAALLEHCIERGRVLGPPRGVDGGVQTEEAATVLADERRCRVVRLLGHRASVGALLQPRSVAGCGGGGPDGQRGDRRRNPESRGMRLSRVGRTARRGGGW
jgi:hypothetical protein